MKNTNIAAIVAAAGYSSRMHSFKPFLKFGEYTAVETVVSMLKSSGVNEIIVVAGYRGYEVVEKLKGSGAVCVFNESFINGMFSSIKKGVEALDENIDAFFMMPVDVPLVKGNTLELLKSKYSECGKGILYPAFFGKRGHPPLIDCRYRQTILNSTGEGGLKRILECFEEDALEVPVFDEMVLMDMDTRADYEKLMKYYLLGAPSRSECEALLDIYGVPASVKKHSAEVAGVSMKILDTLGSVGNRLDSAALEAAALLHDIAKTQKNHALMGAQLMRDLGYEHIGNIMSTHTDIEVDETGAVNENEILYLADKLVKEDKRIPLQNRLAQCINAYGGNREVFDKITSRFEAAEKIKKKIEVITGRALNYE